MKRYCFLFIAMGLLAPVAFGQTVIVDEDFESYGSEAALHAVWGGISGTLGGVPAGTPAEVEERFQLTVEPAGINADFNGDGTVDAADYPKWRKDIGTQPEYDAWKDQFGGPPDTGGSGTTYLNHLANTPNDGSGCASGGCVPDGSVEYIPDLDPNFVPPNYPGGDGSIFPSEGFEPIVLRADIFTPSSALQRNTIGLRSNAPANLFEIGAFNGATVQAANPAGTTGAANTGTNGQNRAFALFGIRAQLFALQSDVNPDWQFFAFDPLWDTSGNGLVTAFEAFAALGITEGWHTVEATFAPTLGGESGDITLTATIDLLRDGMNNAQNTPGVDGEIVITNLRVTQAGFDSLRLGGPSALYTTTDMGFDNILLTGPLVPPLGAGNIPGVPEPSAIALALFAATGLLVGGRRRQSS